MAVVSRQGTVVRKVGFDGKSGWELHGPQSRLLSTEEMLLYMSMLNINLLSRFEEIFPQFNYLSEESMESGRVHVLEAITLEGAKLICCFDVRTGLLTQIGEIAFDQYHEVDGIQSPFKITFLNGRGSIRFQEVSQNLEIDRTIFTTP